jgi:AcrR family transcriptional regulator
MSVNDSPSARERIITTAYDLFTRRGIGAVGVDEVVEKSDVAKTTLYRHFPSKEDLVLAFLEEREQQWTVEVMDRQPRKRADDPEGQLLAIFDVMDDWFHRRTDYEACSFIKVLFEMGAEGRVGDACIAHLNNIRDIVRTRAELAGLRNATEFAWSFNILIKGSIVCAAEGDPDAARRAKAIAAWLIKQHRPTDRAGASN